MHCLRTGDGAGYLIMDEPVSSLDPNGKKMVQSILGQLSINGNTTVLVDNNLVWSAGIVDHVIGLLDGEVVFDGSRDDFFRDFELQERLGSSSLRKWKYTGNYPAIFPAWTCSTRWKREGNRLKN